MSAAPYLTPEQVHELNEKHGWFECGDAQSDVSKAFAQDAIAMHERMRAAAPDMLAALQAILPFCAKTSASEGGAAKYSASVAAADLVRAAIDKATGVTS